MLKINYLTIFFLGKDFEPIFEANSVYSYLYNIISCLIRNT